MRVPRQASAAVEVVRVPAAVAVAPLHLPGPHHAARREDDVRVVGVADADPRSERPAVLGLAGLRPLRVE
eukprot:5744248-Alexandrium_andersonii.AAC.1